MNRCWSIHTIFSLLIAGYWGVAVEQGIDPEDLFESMERRLRANLIASQLL